MTKAFSKGEEVTFFQNWDRRGAVYFRHCVVYSCGAKRMVLTDAISGEEVGRNFQPVRAKSPQQGTYPRMTDEEATAQALKIAEVLLVEERQHLTRCLGNMEASQGYRNVIQKDIDLLHAPEAVNRTGK